MGLTALKTLLESHARRPYVHARRAEVEDWAKRLTFRAQAKIPDPATLVSGRLKSWDGARGAITIEYRPGDCGDLESRDGAYFFPMLIRGASTLVIEGKAYPRLASQSPMVSFGGERNPETGLTQIWVITFGVPPYTVGNEEVWMPASIRRFDDGEKVTVVEKDRSPAKPGAKYKLVAQIGRNSIAATVNGKAIGRGSKHAQSWGFLGFEATGWTEATLSGIVEPSWLQARIDEKLAEQRKVFDAVYDPARVLPAWWFEERATTPATETPPERELPEDIDEALLATLEKVYGDCEKADWEEARKGIETLRARGAPESTCSYLDGLALVGMGQTAEALAAVEKSCGLRSDFADAHMLRARLLRKAGRHEESRAAMEQALDLSPARAELYEVLAWVSMLGGDITAAVSVTQRAASKGITSPRLTLLSAALVKAQRGPTWAKTYEYKSRHYHVLSDIDKETCMAAARVLEEAYTSYRVNLEWVNTDRTQLFKVYLFGGQAGFLRYQEDIQQLMGRPTEHAAGLYSPLLKQLLIWNLPTREEMIATIRHEGFHQYLDQVMPDPPVWFNEGLAVYHEDGKFEGGRMVFGQVQEEYVEVLRSRGLFPLKDYLFWDAARFYTTGEHAYAQGWALCHMLRHGTREHKQLFKKLVEAFQTSEDSDAVVRRLIPASTWKALEEELTAYVEKL
jgi:tetratricopeptide (TPR) repeat protein